MLKPLSDQFFMNEALKQALLAFNKEEVPVGAIIVLDNQIIARGYNLTQTLNDTTAHAEIQAITSATNYLGAKYLNNATIYITLEPCVMCIGAIFWSKISRVVYAAKDIKQGYSKYEQVLLENNLSLISPKTTITNGVLEAEASFLLTKFFKNKRKNENYF